jgi:rifampicin phosphotransferase
MIQDFRQLEVSQTSVGSKAYVLAMMAQKDLPVPAGLILSHEITSEPDWQKVLQWWESVGCAPVAVRSSAFGEDSQEMSFAGQNKTFLNVSTALELREAIHACFASIHGEASQSYRQFFTGDKKEVPMNVILQVMVKARYAGVYFSFNPTRKEEGAILEYVEGLGEALVSGQVNPFRVWQDNAQSEGPLERNYLNQVFSLGKKVEEKLQQHIDMEWAIDEDFNLHLLQARPITVARSENEHKKILDQEFKRIEDSHPPDGWWDGATFAEWTGRPSRLTFEVWKRSFAPGGAFDLALKELGYQGFTDKSYSPQDSILEQLFGRAFIDMSRMVPLYFGPIPYRINPLPKPHLKFEWYKISTQGILHTPRSLWKMLKVGWQMTTRRRDWIEKSRKELVDFKHKMQRPQQADFYADWSEQALLNQWQKEIANFSRVSLKWPLVLVVLIEATHQSLRAVLKSVTGPEKVEGYLQRWMGAGLQTASFEMNRYFVRALEEPLKREFFFSRFGHRGPGELDLSRPRWEELGQSAFGAGKSSSSIKHTSIDVEDEIHQFKTFKDAVLIEEWRLLKELLELREQWKMEILRPYAHIRYLSLEMAKRLGLGPDIFHLTVEEIQALMNNRDNFHQIREIIQHRKEELDAFKGVYLPDVLMKSKLKTYLEQTEFSHCTLRGTPLSHGIIKGEVRVVGDPSEVDFSNWPEDVILVTEATDPGWTALFTRAKGVIVERGGVLSHCAILARELGLPSINLPRATEVLKNGDKIWLDGQNGGVKHDKLL